MPARARKAIVGRKTNKFSECVFVFLFCVCFVGACIYVCTFFRVNVCVLMYALV